jgi:SPP1 gp7 family putative phage head morphogenesis protein
MQKVLQPVIHRPGYTALVKVEIDAWFNEVIFGPLIEMLREAGVGVDTDFEQKQFDEFARRERANAGTEAIRAALASGRIWYSAGAFGSARGFNATLSRELRAIGARYDRDLGVFTIASSNLPIELKGAVDTAQSAAQKLHAAMATILSEMGRNVAQAPVGLQLAEPLQRIVTDLGKQFEQSVKGIESISVQPILPVDVRSTLDNELKHNLELSIKNFAQEEIPELRRLVEENLMMGGRLDRLSKIIESRYGVTKRKAEFLAAQETSLLTAKFREERARNAGSVKYIWYTRHDDRVRHDHEELNGKIFFWSQPPVVDKKRGRHAHPGEDYGCRCFSRPIIELPQAKEAA